MATSKSRPWTCLQRLQDQTWPFCHCLPRFSRFGLSFRNGKRVPLACVQLKMIRRELKLFRNCAVKGYGLEGQVVKHGDNIGGGEGYHISEADMGFVKALREAQPYVHLHRGSTFVVLISTEIVSSPSLDVILKGAASFSEMVHAPIHFSKNMADLDLVKLTKEIPAVIELRRK